MRSLLGAARLAERDAGARYRESIERLAAAREVSHAGARLKG